MNSNGELLSMFWVWLFVGRDYGGFELLVRDESFYWSFVMSWVRRFGSLELGFWGTLGGRLVSLVLLLGN